MTIKKALVENPCYQNNYLRARNHWAWPAYLDPDAEFVELDVILVDGVYYPYYDRERMTELFFGSRVKEIRG
jgi:hypothetical protein